MAFEAYSTLGASTLSGSYTSGGGSLSVASAASFPASGNFRVRVDNEIFKVTAVAGTTFTVTGAQEGTSAANHSSGAVITEVVTALSVDAIRGDQCQTGAVASAVANKSGNLYFPNNCSALLRDTGAVMVPFGPLYPLADPTLQSYAWINQSTGSVTVVGNTIFLQGVATSSQSLTIRKFSAPGTPYTMTVGIIPALFNVNFGQAGVLFRESSSGKLSALALNYDNTRQGTVLAADKWTDPTTYSGASYTLTANILLPQSLVWLRIADDGSNRLYSFSTDGLNFRQVFSVGRTDFLTANEIGFFTNANQSNVVPAMTVISLALA